MTREQRASECADWFVRGFVSGTIVGGLVTLVGYFLAVKS